ncbi:MAG: hypothetical protein IIC30_05605 [Chloroflexi bacterium]|nr:hypothetical protein [Chloroflexota bacterium]
MRGRSIILLMPAAAAISGASSETVGRIWPAHLLGQVDAALAVLDPSVRATVLSMHSRATSAIATVLSIRFGPVAGAIALLPGVGLPANASRRDADSSQNPPAGP